MTASWAMEGDPPYASYTSVVGFFEIVPQLSIALHCIALHAAAANLGYYNGSLCTCACNSSLDTCFHYQQARGHCML